MTAKKDFLGAMNKMTGRDFVLSGDKNNEGVERPFGEGLREELERETDKTPIREIAINQLQDNPFQYLARPEMDEQAMEELVNSIKQNGFYGALLARRKRGILEQYELAFGHRRKEAAHRAGLTTLPVKIIDLTEAQMARIMASENFAREDLTPLGEANVVGHLNINQNLSVCEIARIVGKGEGWVNLRLSLYKAPQDIKEMAAQKAEMLGHIRLLLQVKDVEYRAELIRDILDGKLTRTQLEAQVKLSKQKSKSEITEPEIANCGEGIVTSITSTTLYSDSDEFHDQETKARIDEPEIAHYGEEIVTNVTSTTLYSDSDEFHNIGTDSAAVNMATTVIPSKANNEKAEKPADLVIYHKGVPLLEDNPLNDFAFATSQEYKAQYARSLERLDQTIEELERLTAMGVVEPTKEDEVYLVEIMERLTTLLTKAH